MDNGPIRGYVPKHSAKPQEQQPQYQQPQYQPQQYQQPQYQQPQYQQPQYQQPQYQQPQYQPQQYQPQQYQQPQYQPQQYQQPQYQQTQYRQTHGHEKTAGGITAFIKKRDTMLLIGAALALLWLIFSWQSVADVVNSVPEGDSAEALGAQIGTTIGVTMLMPYFIVTAIGTIFNWVGWIISKKGFALTAAILFCVALPLGVGNAVGLIPSLVLCFVGYSRLKKQQAAQQ